MLHLELKHYEDALRDFDQVVDLGHGDGPVHAGRGVALEGLGRHAAAEAAFAEAFARAANLPPGQRHRLQWVYGFAVAARLPKEAAAAFDAVLSEDPNQPQALLRGFHGRPEYRDLIQPVRRAQ